MTEVVQSMFQLGSLPVLERAMQFREVRHRSILSNIANADTPGYRRRDLDVTRFQDLIGKAIRERAAHHPGRFEMPSGAHASGLETARESWAHPGSRRQDPLRHDGNDVSLDREMAQLAQNSGLYRTYAQLLAKSYGQMRAAINGRGEG